jgi:hypothetical protein
VSRLPLLATRTQRPRAGEDGRSRYAAGQVEAVGALAGPNRGPTNSPGVGLAALAYPKGAAAPALQPARTFHQISGQLIFAWQQSGNRTPAK